MLETAPVFLYRIGNRNGNIFDYKVGILKYNPNECTISTILSSINPMVLQQYQPCGWYMPLTFKKLELMLLLVIASIISLLVA